MLNLLKNNLEIIVVDFMIDEPIADDELSGVMLPRYKESPNDNPDDLIRKRRHNKLATEALEKRKEANKISDDVNKTTLPKFQKGIRIKKILSLFVMILGIITVILGVLIGPLQGSLSVESIGIIIAGFGIFWSGGTSLISMEDETFYLLFVSRTNENQLIADHLEIETQLSFIQNEIINVRKDSLKK